MHQPGHSHLPQVQTMQFASPAQMQTQIQANMHPTMQTNMHPTMQTNMHPTMQTNMQPQMQMHMQTNTHPQSQLHTCLHTQMHAHQAQMQPQIQAHLQTHIQPQIQAHIQTQLQPQVMLCPVQYIPRMLVPSSPAEDVVQQNQTFQNPATFIINVQNPPPWIQNRNAYLPQMQLNNMPYMHQNMVQNPVINYYQPMVMEHRLIPNAINQNPPQINQNMQQQIVQNTPNEENQPEMKQDPPTLQPIQKNEVPSPTQTTKPQYSTIAQMITVTPLSTPQTSEIPQHIRTQLPDGLSVRTYKPPARIEYQSTIAPPVGPRMPKPETRNSTTNTDAKVNRKRVADNTNETTLIKRSCVINQEVIDNVTNTQVKITVDSLPMIDVAALNNTLRQHNTQQTPNTIQAPTTVGRRHIEEKLIRNTVFVQARGRVDETVKNELINNKITQAHDTSSKPPEIRQSETNEPSSSQMSSMLQHSKPITSEEEFKDSCASVYVPRSIKNKNANENVTPTTSSESKREIHNTNNYALSIKEMLSGKVNQPKVTESSLTKQDQETPVFKTISPMFSGSAMHLLNNHERQVFLLSKVIDDKSTAETKHCSKDKNTTNINNNVEETATKIVISKEIGGSIKTKEFKVVENETSDLKIDIQIFKNNKKSNNKEETMIKNDRKEVKKPKTDKTPSAKVGAKDTDKRYVLTHVLDGHIIQESNIPFDIEKPSPPKKEPEVEKRKPGRPRKYKKVDSLLSPSNTRETRLSFNIKKDKLFNNNRELSVSLCKLENSGVKKTYAKKDKSKDANVKEPVVKTGNPTEAAERSVLEAIETVVENKGTVSVPKETILKQVFNKGQSESFVKAKRTLETKASEAELKATFEQTTAILEKRVDNTKSSINYEDAIGVAVKRIVESIKPVNETNETFVETKKSAKEETKELTTESKSDTMNNKTDCDNPLNEDNPFGNVIKSTVRSWSVSDVTSHLTTHHWHEAAQLLGDQEIDGESLLLVSKEQLLLIGIDEEQAQVLSEFIEGGTDTEDSS